MRQNYSLSSQELNDSFNRYYSNLIYLLGFENSETGAVYSGVYDQIESTGNTFLEDTEVGIPHISNNPDTIGTNINGTSLALLTLLETQYKLSHLGT
jgi:hypothetical protein